MAEHNQHDKHRELMLRQHDSMKQKHPDALLLFRHKDFYEVYREDALKVSKILGLPPQQQHGVTMVAFPYHTLDIYLPKLIRAKERVAICDLMEPPKQKQQEKTEQSAAKEKTQEKSKDYRVIEKVSPIDTDMATKKKEQAKQEEPTKMVKSTATEKPEKTKEAKADVKTEAKTDKKAETKTEQTAEAKQERKPREPQMVTVNGEKVTHGHAYQSKPNPEDWYFTAKMDGKPLKPQKMDAADLAAYQKKEVGVPQLMEKYYPTKLQPKVADDAYKIPKAINGPDGEMSISKFNVYKEKDEQRPDFGKYKFYAQVGEAKMSTVASRADLNAYFDRVATPQQLVEKNFGERLHLKSAYEKYALPEGVDPKGVRIAKDKADNKWKVSVDMGEKGRTSKKELSFDDGYSLFKAKTATREQIAAKYLNPEVKGMMAARAAKQEQAATMKR